MERITALKDKYKGETAWIIGKGPSLVHLRADDIGGGPVIAINHAIIKVEEIDLPNPVYSMQQDGPETYMVRPKEAALLVSDLPHAESPGATSADAFKGYGPRYVFNQVFDLGCKRDSFSLNTAMSIAELMGCTKIVFVSCDAFTSDDIRTAYHWDHQDKVYLDPTSNYRGQRPVIMERLSQIEKKGIEIEWLTPTIKHRLKIGIGMTIGEIVKPATTASVALIAYYIGQKGYDISYLTEQSAYLDENANHVFERAVREGLDYLMMIETDVETIDDDDVLSRMLAYHEDAVSGIYYGGKYPHRPLIHNFADIYGGLLLPQTFPENQAFYIDACGSGFMLISKKVLTAFTPQFMYRNGKPYSYYYANYQEDKQPEILWRQDIAFCWRLKLLGFRVLVDPSIRLGHWKDHRITKEYWDLSREHMEQTGVIV